MRKLPIRIAVAVITLLLGLMLSSVLKHLRRAQPPQEQSSIPALTPSPVPAQFVNTGDDDNYPDTLGLQPFEIEWFIDNRPKARLSRLWERLNVKVSNPVAREDLA